MKLQPEQLIPYLPYSLKVIMEGKKTNVAWMSTKNIAVIRPNGIGDYKKISWKNAHFNIKPILRPLSDLTKSNFPDGSINQNTRFWEFSIRNGTISGFGYDAMCELFKEKYDVFGLIDKDLAIDINTLVSEV